MKKKSKIWIPIVIGVVVAAAVAVGLWLILSRDEDGSKPADKQPGDNASAAAPTFDMSVPHKVEPPNAEVLLDSYGDIRSKIVATESEQVQGESTLVSDFAGRGLDGQEIYSQYNMAGEYLGESSVSGYSNDLHPIYSTYYTAGNGEVWLITSINGVIMAEPYGYNYATNDGSRVPVIITETDFMYSYDGTTNTFFEFVPKSSVIRLLKVEQINSEVLESLTSDKLGG